MCTFFFRLYEANLSGPLPGVQCQCSRFISLLSGRILKSKRWGNTYTQVWYWLSNYWSTHTVQDQGLFQRAISRTSSHCPRASNSLHYCRTSYLVRIYAENRPSDDFFFYQAWMSCSSCLFNITINEHWAGYSYAFSGKLLIWRSLLSLRAPSLT